MTADAYVLAAKEDHIAPWMSSFATPGLLGGDARFVLTSSGHMAGIVNPPGPKRRYWTNDAAAGDGEAGPEAAEAWLAVADEHARLVVAGLGRLDRGAGGSPPPAARPGQRRPSAARRRPRDLRPPGMMAAPSA